MENNDSDVPVTSVDSKVPVQLEQNAQSTVSDKPLDALTPQAPDASNRGDSPVRKEGSTQANNAPEAHLESREASYPEAKHANSSSTPSTQSYVPPVKRFSAVNINKKFLQKNQTSTATTSSAISNTTANKQSGVIARPAPQTAHSHSRLVTAKLTATPVSSSPGPGWSRSNSVTPPAPSPVSTGPTKGPAPSTTPVGGPPQLAPGGKIIQPQPLKQKTDGPGRPAWRSVQPGASNSALQAQKDFPTAAEAAKSRLAKIVDGKATQAGLSDAQKQTISETADAFRGVHLDPNAHHWDEMEEEDNDDFLGDVIEFGDGRQYTIHVTEEMTVDPKALEENLEAPVSKEDRFVDDFDRSWPKSRQESSKNDSRDHGLSEASSNFSGHSPVSSRDPIQSRVLFNDRLNRMEPISGGRTGPGGHGQPHGVQSHRGRPDGFAHFHGGQKEREAPPHSSFRRPHEPPWTTSRGRDHPARDPQSELPTSYFHDGYHDRKGRYERPSSRGRGGHSPNGRTLGSREPSTARSALNGAPSVASSDHSSRYAPSVRSNRGQFSQSGRRELERQIPPHLTQMQNSVQRERPGPDPRTRGYGPSSVASAESIAAKDKGPSESEEPSHFTAPPSGVAGANSIAPAPPDDVETLRKAYLHERAERARIRRRQEEEERLKAQERARKKAEELEAKIAAAKAAEEAKNTAQPTSAVDIATSPSSTTENVRKPTESEVLRVIEGAIGSIETSHMPSNGKAEDSRKRETDDRRPSIAKPSPRQENERSTSAREQQESEQPKRLAKADQADSWRVKSKPSTLPVENSKNGISRAPAASVLPDVRAFDIQADESTEVIDFSDVSRLVQDRNQEKQVSQTISTTTKPTRPVASDFFRGTVGQRPEQDSWRRAEGPVVSQATDNGGGQPPAQLSSKAQVPQTNGISSSSPSQPLHAGFSAVPKHLRSPNVSYREAPLSTLDDTMSRIKGALDIMHSAADHECRGEARDPSGTSTVRLPVPSTSSAKPAKWLPPALRQPGMPPGHRRTDTFEPTHPEPPRSPAPPNDNFVIRLPNISRQIDPLTKRQVSSQKYFAPVRWEILSFDPPVEGMTKRSLSINDVLFGKPQGSYKSRRYRVCLPKSKTPSEASRYDSQGTGDTASHTSGSKDVANGDVGSPKSALSNWLSASGPARIEKDDASDGRISSMLDITSRSPPPELASRTEQVPAVSRVVSRPRSQKSLDVSDVGFYRDVQRSTVNNVNIPTVTFTVSSELESQVDPSMTSNTIALPSASSKAPSQPSSEEKDKSSDPHLSGEADQVPSSGQSTQSASQPESSLSGKAFDQQGDPFLHRPPVTPPQNTPSSWPKSPARVPDPELLKAVWSQPSNNDTGPAVNSLKNIADDLPAVPFMLQEVKSEGGTPPPAPGPVVPPTRMSASEVTRAFQTVPSGPSNGVASSPLRVNQMPSNTTSSIGSQRALKPASIGLPPPPAVNPNAARHPPYTNYSTSMTGHTASPPTMVYSHVMPSGMAGSPVGTPYGQPMWMPVVQQGPQMVRAQSSSPYSPSMMPFAMPGGQNGMYHSQSSMPNAQGSPAAYPSAPSPSQMMVSPVMAHATAPPTNTMYPASPMVIHLPPPSTGPDNRGYPPGPVGMGRGALPMQMDPRSHPTAPPAPPGSRYTPGYTPVPPQSFVPRPW